MGYSFRLAARVLLYAPPHWYISRGALAGTINSSMGHKYCRFSNASILWDQLFKISQYGYVRYSYVGTDCSRFTNRRMNEWMFNDTQKNV